jgi:hypothetical protein
VVDDLNLLTQALKIEDDWGAGQPAQGGDLSIKGQSNSEATLYLGAPSSGFFVKAKEDGPDPGLTIGAKNAGKGIVISVGGDTRIGGGNPSRAKLEIDGGDRWLNHPFPPAPSFNKPWSKSLLLTANAPSLTFNTNSHNTRFGMGMRKDGSDPTQLHIFSTTDGQLLADNNNGTGTYQSHLVIREDGRIRIGPGDLNIYTDTFMRLDVAGNTQINGRLYVAGSDFELGYNDGRNKGSRPRCRALAHTDDGIGNDNLIINVGGDFEGGVHVQGPKLIIDGNVGIGTADPKAPLHVKGNGGIINLEGSDHSYLQFYPNEFNNGRKAWLGFGSSGTSTLSFMNETYRGNIQISADLGISLNTGSGISINNSIPIHLKRYKNLNLNVTDATGTGYNTGYSSALYTAAVVGFKHDSSVSTTAAISYMENKNNTWWIIGAPLVGNGQIDILFIRRELSDLIGY